MGKLTINPQQSALVLIDLQRGIVNRTLAPHSGATVVINAVRLAEGFRRLGALVVLVHVDFREDGRDALQPEVDEVMRTGKLPADWATLMPELRQQPSDLVITKRQWGAFYGTELDLQLRRRHIDTLVLGGIATNYGVESTARVAYELGYGQVLVEDAMTSTSTEAHSLSLQYVFPRLGRVRSTDEVLSALGG